MNNPQLGIDTWEGQLEIEESVLKQNDVNYMFIRLNDINGGHHKDENFDRQWSEAESFHRAPYFVYNPWVDGQTNFIWLLSNMPTGSQKAYAVGIDIEVRKDGYSPSVYAAEVDKFMKMAILHWNVVCYTGEWFLPYLSYWPDYVPYWWAQYPSVFYGDGRMITWDQLRVKLQQYTYPFNASKVPGPLLVWQFTGDTLILPGNNRKMDVNIFYGDLEGFFGGTVVIPPIEEDVPTYPYEGYDSIKLIEGKRNGWKFWLYIFDPKRVKFTVDTGYPESVPSVARRKDAPIAVNASDWDRDKNSPDYGKVIYEPGMPAVVFYGDRVDIFHQNLPQSVQKVYCVRYLIQDGVIKPYLYDPNDPKYEYPTATEGHSRTIGAKMSDGRMMIFIGEGVYPNQGFTLYEAAKVIQQYDGVTAGDWGGGGDTTLVVKDTVLNVTENITENGNHFARQVPQRLLIYPEGDDMSGTIGTTKGVVVKFKTNVKPMSGSETFDPMMIGDYVYGELNASRTDLTDFDHYFKENGTRVELGQLCKCTVENMVIVSETEPTTDPDPDPDPDPTEPPVKPTILLTLDAGPDYDVSLDGNVIKLAPK